MTQTLDTLKTAGKWGLFLLAVSTLSFSLAACNTIEGAGEDVEGIGEGTQNVAQDVEDEM